MPVLVSLLGNRREMSPALLAATRRALKDIMRYLNQDHSALEQQYRAGRMSDIAGFDWYADHEPR